jgi:hypothetical protein
MIVVEILSVNAARIIYISHPLVEGFLGYDGFAARSAIGTWTVD